MPSLLRMAWLATPVRSFLRHSLIDTASSTHRSGYWLDFVHLTAADESGTLQPQCSNSPKTIPEFGHSSPDTLPVGRLSVLGFLSRGR